MRKRKKLISKNIMHVTDYVSKRAYVKNRKRAPKAETTPEAMEKVNQRRAELKLRLLIDNNFRSGDYYLTLTFKKKVDWEEAKAAIQKFNRNMRAYVKRQGGEYKYLYVPEGKNRIHFHILISKTVELYPNVIKRYWPHGLVEIKLYQGEVEDAMRISSYFVKEERAYHGKDVVFTRRWNASTNLVQPKERVEVIKSDFWRERISVPSGYYLDADSVFVGVSVDGYPFRVYQLLRIQERNSDGSDYDG